jgi:ATP-binding cassette subfamily F protein uup
VVVSHDRYFLSNAVKQVMELNRCYPGGYFLVKGNYEEFLSKKIDFLESQAAYENSLNSRLKLENAWLQRGARARSTKAKFRVEEAGRLQEEFSAVSERNRTPKAAGINFNATGRKTKKLLWAENINKKMGDKALFSLPGLQLRPGNCVGILGPNGSGKTTLLRVLSGSVAADSGMVETADGLKMVVFEQDRSSLNLDETLKEALCPLGDSVCFRGVEVHYAAWAARFLFEKEQLRMPVRNLSGGEQARILIARMMLEAADVLFLDEPTNDLDISTLEMLEQNLEDFPGAIVLVTHDRRMLDRLATEVIGLDGDGNAAVYADFLQWYQKRRARQNNNQSGVKAGHKPAAGRRKKLSFHQQKELDGMEELVLQAEVELDEIKKQLQSEFVLQNPDKLQELCTALPLKQQEVDDLYERWNELEQLQAGLK